MRRFLYSGDISQLKTQSYDVIIIGSGLAGLYTALNLDEKLTCVVLSKAEIAKSNSWLAQGGIAAVISKDDQVACHFQDTLVAGAGLCDQEAVDVLVNEGPNDIHNLMSMNVPFDLDEEGDLHITREGGHTKNRVLHCGGDATGRETVKTLASIAMSKSNIRIKESVFLLDILTEDLTAVGVVIKEGNAYKILLSNNIVVCTGGIGQVYQHTTNPIEATGDGIAAAIRAGAHTKNMEFVQFHPTALYSTDSNEQSFLISEAVRGEGGILRNKDGDAYMKDKHPMKDLAPRDIVTRVTAAEMSKTNREHVYLDITSKTDSALLKRFPTIFNKCKENNIDISKEWIPVCPVQHYLMGGLKTDLNGMTNIKGLYASGEAACTGVHGANRLASNSLLECLVFGRRCAHHINENYQDDVSNFNFGTQNGLRMRDCNVDNGKIRKEIKKIMTEKGGIIRDETSINAALSRISSLIELLDSVDLTSKQDFEVYNMAIVSKEILLSAVSRKQNVGAHYRTDIMG